VGKSVDSNSNESDRFTVAAKEAKDSFSSLTSKALFETNPIP